MINHNICFHGQIRKISILLDWKKHLFKSYEQAWDWRTDEKIWILDKKSEISCHPFQKCHFCNFQTKLSNSADHILKQKKSEICQKSEKSIALVKALFSIQKFWYFSYFFMKTCCGYSLEAPRQGASNEYPQHMFSWRNKKNIYWIPSLI